MRELVAYLDKINTTKIKIFILENKFFIILREF